jgi:2-polyprenyl-3-methyl-5-hydroxy-6-metoxy-1,4-benzoquinol methylase
LEAAAGMGSVPIGIEPDAQVASHSTLDVRVGLFPDVLSKDEKFDVIAFNDVLEHLPDSAKAVAICYDHLRPGGLLSINIPTANGVAFRIACKLARIGIRGPYLRLWQFGLPSPHLHYFTTSALTRLIRERGFRVVRMRELSALTREGLWQRTRMIDRPGVSSAIAFAGMYATAGLLNRPGLSDILHVIAERPASV